MAGIRVLRNLAWWSEIVNGLKLLMVQLSTGSNDPLPSSPPPTTPIIEEAESDTNPTTPSHDNPHKPSNGSWFTIDDIPKVKWPIQFQEFSTWIDVQMLRTRATSQKILKEIGLKVFANKDNFNWLKLKFLKFLVSFMNNSLEKLQLQMNRHDENSIK